MNIFLQDQNLSTYEKEQIKQLLSRQNKTISSDLEQMWYLMDLVWDDFNCDNNELNWENISQFYSHPVWLLNGLFIEQHDISMGHRHAISDWIVKNNITNVVDYGGGFGTLSRLISEKNSQINIQVYEPYPSRFTQKKIKKYKNIEIVDNLMGEFDCLLSTDVLEHLPDPLKDFSVMINSVKNGGYLVIANAFYPMIKCHLPQVFHFRHTFDLFARLMGLEIIGKLEGSHATIYRKNKIKKLNWTILRNLEKVSKQIFFERITDGPLRIVAIKQLFFELFKQKLRSIKQIVFS